jgi:hypothetical protein
VTDVSAIREAKLRESIEELYATFGCYRLPEGWRNNFYIAQYTKEEILRSTPVRKLTDDDLSIYHWKAMTTWGSVEDFKHFVPRLLELIVPRAERAESYAPRGLEPFMVATKLRYGQWSTWPKRERIAVQDYFMALWSLLLVTPTLRFDHLLHGTSILEWLSLVAHAESSIVRYLLAWEKDLDDEVTQYGATVHLAKSIDCGGTVAIDCDSVLHDYFEKLEQQNEECATWLFSDEVFQLMENAYFRWQDKPEASSFSQAHYWLHWLREERRWKKSLIQP